MKGLLDARTNNKPWDVTVDIILSELYGDKLKWLSALGTRGSIGIDYTLYCGLWSKFSYLFSQTVSLLNHLLFM